MKRQVEIYCGSYYDAKQAEYGGASRIVLSHYQYDKGLTPSIGEFLKVKENTNLEIICMLRPRTCGYCYQMGDIETMFLDAEILLDNGVDGIAFGFLDIESDLDIQHTREMISLIHSYHKKAIFNQAIDDVDDIDRTMNILITMGIDGIYTQGLQKNLFLGKEMIKYLQLAYGKHLEIVAVDNTRDLKVNQFIEETGISVIQSACLSEDIDATSYEDYFVVNWKLVEQLVDEVEEDYSFEII